MSRIASRAALRSTFSDVCTARLRSPSRTSTAHHAPQCARHRSSWTAVVAVGRIVLSPEQHTRDSRWRGRGRVERCRSHRLTKIT